MNKVLHLSIRCMQHGPLCHFWVFAQVANCAFVAGKIFRDHAPSSKGWRGWRVSVALTAVLAHHGKFLVLVQLLGTCFFACGPACEGQVMSCQLPADNCCRHELLQLELMPLQLPAWRHHMQMIVRMFCCLHCHVVCNTCISSMMHACGAGASIYRCLNKPCTLVPAHKAVAAVAAKCQASRTCPVQHCQFCCVLRSVAVCASQGFGASRVHPAGACLWQRKACLWCCLDLNHSVCSYTIVQSEHHFSRLATSGPVLHWHTSRSYGLLQGKKGQVHLAARACGCVGPSLCLWLCAWQICVVDLHCLHSALTAAVTLH